VVNKRRKIRKLFQPSETGGPKWITGTEAVFYHGLWLMHRLAVERFDWPHDVFLHEQMMDAVRRHCWKGRQSVANAKQVGILTVVAHLRRPDNHNASMSVYRLNRVGFRITSPSAKSLITETELIRDLSKLPLTRLAEEIRPHILNVL